jgi:site-specific DNA-methyltransferase (adenine-specific)
MFKLICGDCIAELKKIEASSIDACVTSPPYNLGIDYKEYSDNIESTEYLMWTARWVTEVMRVLKPHGSLFLNFAGSLKHPYLPYQVVLRLRSICVLQNTFHWIKSISINDVTHGHFKPINSDNYVTNCHEFVFQFSDKGDARLNRLALGVPYMDKSNIKRWKSTGGNDKRCRGNTWFVQYPTIQKRSDRPHPAVFPPELAENCIKISGAKSVIDPFCGIGSTLVAAHRCGITDCTGIDIDKSYIAEASKTVALLNKQ